MCVIAVAKTNLGMPSDALTYRLESVDVNCDGGGTLNVARVAWIGTAKIRADALTLLGPEREEEKSAVDDACDAIIECLSSGPKAAAELEEAVTRRSKAITFRRARRRLVDRGHIQRSGGGFGGTIFWSLVP